MKSNLAVHFSSQTDDWATPQKTFDELNAEFGPLELDVCAEESNAKCGSFYDKEANGLEQSWTVPMCVGVDLDTKVVTFRNIPRRCWMNPPYGRGIGEWVKKAYEESQKGCLVVCLLPARTDTAWFHDYCTKGEVRFLRGRLKFGNATNSAPFPSMVVVFRPPN